VVQSNSRFSNHYRGQIVEQLQATLGLALLGQDVVIFICSNMAAVVQAGRFSI
jgi:hypothetical protein